MEQFTYDSNSEAATAALGTALAEALPQGGTVALVGTLGAGKTRLVQAIAAGCGVDRRLVVSPTFVIVQEYRGRHPLYHIDAYRVGSEREFWQLGVDEYFESDGLVLVEWADRVWNCLPAERVEVRIDVLGDQKRRFFISTIGPRYDNVVGILRSKL
jgi:tRNA threonylcarbamoyladenosine biosynthesis protein TsaE